jgi:hypothetical protein
MHERKQPHARALRVLSNRIADPNASVIVQAGFAIWIQGKFSKTAGLLAKGKINLPKVFPIAQE